MTNSLTSLPQQPSYDPLPLPGMSHSVVAAAPTQVEPDPVTEPVTPEPAPPLTEPESQSQPEPEPDSEQAEQAAPQDEAASILASAAMSNPLDKAVCVGVTLRKWGIGRKGDMSKITTDADKDMMRVGKSLLSSPEYTKISQFDANVRKWIRLRSLPSLFKDGFYLVSKQYVVRMRDKLREFKDEREVLVDEFLDVYPTRRSEAVNKLKSQYNPLDYPTVDEMRQLFGMEWNFIQFGTPTDLNEIDPEIFEEERAKYAETWRNASEELIQLMRHEAKALIGNLANRLTNPGEGKRRPTLRDAAVSNVQEFLEFFDVRNINDDSELAALIARARTAMTGVDPDSLRNSDDLRSQVHAELAAVAAELDKIVVEKPRRQITFEGEDGE